MNLINQGANWLAKQLKQHASKTVRYRRANDEIAIAAVLGRSAFEVIGDDEAITRVHTRDYIVVTNDLKLNEIAIVPREGDLIIDGNETFRVSCPTNETPWQHVGSERLQIRIHSQRVT